jgi:hypothetical protein
MMFRTRFALFALQFAVAFGLVPGVATAGIIDTVNWAPDTTENGTGTGTMAGGMITVTYNTSVGGPINAGESFSNRDWSTGLGTAAAAPNGTTYDTGAALGEYAGVTQLQVITLSQNVTNPILNVWFRNHPGKPVPWFWGRFTKKGSFDELQQDGFDDGRDVYRATVGRLEECGSRNCHRQLSRWTMAVRQRRLEHELPVWPRERVSSHGAKCIERPHHPAR